MKSKTIDNNNTVNNSTIDTNDTLLKQNADFINLVQVLQTLRKQQQKVEDDIAELKETKREATDNPVAFVQQLKHKEREFPQRQEIPSVPEINMELYSKFEPNDEEEDVGEWTDDDIEQLQMLFIAYSSEKMATRWQKIADRIGKEPKQVELQAEQLELIPKSNLSRKRKRIDSSNYSRKKRKFNSPTTKQSSHIHSKDNDVESSITFSPNIFEDYGIEQENEFDDSYDMHFTIHNGSKCKGCGMEPIRGPRWVCHDCNNTDLCETCYHSAWEDSIHKQSHRLSKADMPIQFRADQWLPLESDDSPDNDSPLTSSAENSPLVSPLLDDDNDNDNEENNIQGSLFDFEGVQLSSSFA